MDELTAVEGAFKFAAMEIKSHPIEFIFLYLLTFYYLFVFAMGIYRAWLSKRLNKFQLILFSPPILALCIIDVLFNYTIAIAIFLQFPPKDNWTLSERLQTYHNQQEDNWRKKIATFICTRMLDPFDPTNNHC